MDTTTIFRYERKMSRDMQNTWKMFSKAMKKVCTPSHSLCVIPAQIGVSLKEYRVHALRDGDPTECTRLLRLILMGVSLEVAEQVSVYKKFSSLASFS